MENFSTISQKIEAVDNCLTMAGVWQCWGELSVLFTSAGLAVKQSEDSFFTPLIHFFAIEKENQREKKKTFQESDNNTLISLLSSSCQTLSG